MLGVRGGLLCHGADTLSGLCFLVSSLVLLAEGPDGGGMGLVRPTFGLSAIILWVDEDMPRSGTFRGHLHLDFAIIAARRNHAGILRIPYNSVCSGLMSLHLGDDSARDLVPDENVAVCCRSVVVTSTP